MVSPFDQLWWEQVHGPAALRRTLARAIRDRGVVFFHHSAPLPWPETFRALVLEEAERRCGSLRFLPPEDRCGQPLSEGEFLSRFAPGGGRGFLSTASLPAFLDRQGALDGQLLWLCGLPEADQAAWAGRLGELAALPAAGRCAVVLELTGKCIRHKKVRTVSADEELRPFDATQFCVMAAGRSDGASELIDYLSALCVELTGPDPERLPRLLSARSALLEDPVSALADLLGLEEQEAVRHVRRAQLKLLLPLLEDLRIALLEALAGACAPLLPYRDEFGNLCASVYDLELRHLVHFRNSGRMDIPPELWGDVRLAHEARNLLMHQMRPLEFSLLRHVLEAAARWRPCGPIGGK